MTESRAGGFRGRRLSGWVCSFVPLHPPYAGYVFQYNKSMPNYRRVYLPGGTFFFTLVTQNRKAIFRDQQIVQMLRESIRYAMDTVGRFETVAMCVLPDHLHCIWTLPEPDFDYSKRWQVIKSAFSFQYRKTYGGVEPVNSSLKKKGESGIWQRRFWSHLITDDEDLSRHIEYIHYNPVKHHLAEAVKFWPWSSFHQYVRDGLYSQDWGNTVSDSAFDSIQSGE